MTSPKYLIRPSSYDYLNGLQASDLIHRYCSIKELYSIVRGKLTLTSPFKWDDLFENPLFRAKLINRDGKPVPLQEAGRKLYCQSWTLEEESDAMWKLFGSGGKGVRVTARSRNLFFQAYNAYDTKINEAVYTKIGKVLYLDETELRKKFESEDKFYKRFMQPNGEGFNESLLFKRKAYLYENEARLIAHDFDGRFGCSETMRLEMETPYRGCDWIENVTFGPAVDPDTYEAHRERLSTRLGLSKEKICSSTLYGKLQYTIDLRKT